MMTRRRNTRHEPVPFDLVIEILLRLPVKSISRFRRVSKQWNSTLRGPNFTASYLAISLSRKNILFTCLKDGETIFFSSPHPQKKPPSPIAANIHMSFPINCPFGICRSVRGLVCGLNQRTSKGRTVSVPLVCNPSTGQSLALPEVQTTRKEVMSCFGYDPIDEQLSVLCMTISYDGGSGSEEHQLLTLGTEKQPSWKMIKCDIPHEPAVMDYTNGFALYDGICINGVLYYLAIVYDEFPDIVCFDIRSEKFSYIKKADQNMQIDLRIHFKSTLVNYKGKLAKLQPNAVTGIQLWVLEDAEKHEWSSYIYGLPLPILEVTELCFVGTTAKGEIVLSPNTISNSFYLIYYSPESNTITRVGIQGMEAFKTCKAYIFLDHVEDLKLMASV